MTPQEAGYITPNIILPSFREKRNPAVKSGKIGKMWKNADGDKMW